MLACEFESVRKDVHSLQIDDSGPAGTAVPFLFSQVKIGASFAYHDIG